MPIDTDVETRMDCYGKGMLRKWTSTYCLKNCCFIEQDLCYLQTLENLDAFKRMLEEKVII